MKNINNKVLLFEMMRKLNKDFKIINELDTKTYSDLMDNTENYPWTKFLGSENKGKKQEKVNDLARERFKINYYKEFPKISTKINTNKGEASFSGIKFNSNYTNYDIIFILESQEHSILNEYIWIKPEKNGYYIDNREIEITDNNSINLITDMLKYNFIKKQ